MGTIPPEPQCLSMGTEADEALLSGEVIHQVGHCQEQPLIKSSVLAQALLKALESRRGTEEEGTLSEQRTKKPPSSLLHSSHSRNRAQHLLCRPRSPLRQFTSSGIILLPSSTCSTIYTCPCPSPPSLFAPADDITGHNMTVNY